MNSERFFSCSRRGNEADDVRSTPTPPRDLGGYNSSPAARDEAVRWMNHGYVCSTRGEGMEAIAAYTRAIDLLRPLPLDEHPDWANSLGAALMNHGQLLHRAHALARASDALSSFDEAICVLTAIPVNVVPWAHRNLAGTHLNRANLLLDLAAESRAVLQPAFREPHALRRSLLEEGGPCASTVGGVSLPSDLHRSVADARFALELVTSSERTDLVSADLALKARRVHCDALGQLLVSAPPVKKDDYATEAAELVDDALALIRLWSGRGENAFAELAVRFFRFGAELYRQHQPHFLVEFLEENLAVAPTCADELRTVAHLALDAALADGAAPALHTFDDPVSVRALATRVDLATARARLPAGSLDPAPNAFPSRLKPLLPFQLSPLVSS